MTTLYFNRIAIKFSDKKLSGVSRNIKVANSNDVELIVKKLHNNEFDCNINLYGYNAIAIFEDFCGLYKYIEAAGGVVKNEKGELLFIKRFEIWDLPKGKIEKGETPLEAAEREVCEETGLAKVKSTLELPDTYHIYQQKNSWFLKKTYWYLMETKNNNKLVPQINEAITEAVWLKKEDANKAISKSYRSLFDALGYLFKVLFV